MAVLLFFLICHGFSYHYHKDLSFYKEHPEDKVFWVDNVDTVGEFLFSFDKQRIYNLFADYPHNLTKEEKQVFSQENPYWAEFFKDRQ